MIRTALALIAALTLSVTLAGCGGGGDDEYGDTPDKRPEPEAKRTPPGPGAGPTATGEEGAGGDDGGGD